MENKILNIIRKNGLKATKPRLLLLDFLQKQKNPVNAESIAKNLPIDKATVYRTLNTLEKNNIIKKINFQENSNYFELVDNKKDHHHIICQKCKKVKDFVGCEYEKLINKIIKQNNDFAKITNHSFELFGICKTCSY